MVENVYIAILLASIATYICRASGVVFSNKLNVNSDLFELIRCISIGIITSVIIKIIFFPKGILEETSIFYRGAAGIICIISFYIFNKNILLSTITSTLVFFLMSYFNLFSKNNFF